MVVDPVSLAVIGGAAGGVAQTFVGEVWGLGKGWLADYFEKHQPKAQEKAQENALDFLVELGNRIQKIEDKTEDDEVFKEKITNSLSDPDFSALLQKALISSARTSSEEKRHLLAQVVSDRLLAGQESLRVLTSDLVVDVIPNLSHKHLKILGLLTLLTWGRSPINIPKIKDNVTYWENYLTYHISPLIPDEEIIGMDYRHLTSVNCISYSVGVYPLAIDPPKEIFTGWDTTRFLNETDIGKKISHLWYNGLEHCQLTSIGGLIGIYVHDEVTESTTDVTNHYGEF